MNARRDKAKQQRNQLNQQLEAMAVKPRKEKDEFVIEVGKFFLDLAKLTFAGVFLTAIMDVSIDMMKVIRWCAIVIAILAALGFILLRKGTTKG